MYTHFSWIKIEMIVVILVLLLPLTMATGALQQAGASTVAEHMKVINQSFRELRRHFDDTARIEENLALMEKMKRALTSARAERPSKTDDLAESEQVLFLDAYQQLLDQVIVTLEELETAVKEENWDEASVLIKKLNDLKKEGHGKFQKE